MFNPVTFLGKAIVGKFAWIAAAAIITGASYGTLWIGKKFWPQKKYQKKVIKDWPKLSECYRHALKESDYLNCEHKLKTKK